MTPSRLAVVAVLAVTAALAGAGGAEALSLEKVGAKFDQPNYVASDPGDPGRLFVAERKGTIQLLENGVVSEFVDLSAAVGCGGGCSGERGLMSIALAPDFAASGRLYVDYANDATGTIHIAALTAAADRKTADPATLQQLLEVGHAEAANHNGGQIQIGPDGDLYVSTGDGGGGNDQFHHSQKPADPLGKILRLDPDAAPPLTPTFWSLGLRNPYRFSFDALSGDMVIADVGEKTREEIDFAPSPFPGVTGGQGANYGWNCREGLIAGIGDDLPPGECAVEHITDAFVDPVFDYGHDADPDLGPPNRCSITGGYVVRDPALGDLYGSYVYSDYCSGVIRSLRLPAAAGEPATGDCSLGLRVSKPVSFGEDSARRLYVIEQGGQIYRFAGQPSPGCPVPPPPSPPGRVIITGPLSEPSPPSAQPRAGAPTFIGIKAERRGVERGHRALLTVSVSPCEGRSGQLVELRRDGRPHGSRHLDRACSARFTPRIRGAAGFLAATREERGYLAGESRRLRIHLTRRR